MRALTKKSKKNFSHKTEVSSDISGCDDKNPCPDIFYVQYSKSEDDEIKKELTKTKNYQR